MNPKQHTPPIPPSRLHHLYDGPDRQHQESSADRHDNQHDRDKRHAMTKKPSTVKHHM